MSFELNQDLKDLKDLCNEFATKEIYPQVESWDKGEDVRIPNELYEKAGDLGLLGLVVPEEYGGSDMGYMALAVAQEEICRASRAGVMFNFISAPNAAYAPSFLHFGNKAQKEKYAAGTAIGRLKGANAITEPSGSSAVSHMKTTAVRDGDNYIINGQKIFITQADTADYILTFAATDQGVTGFVVDAGTPGMTIGKSEKKMGFHGIGLNPVYYDNCVVPASAMIGKIGEGMEITKDHFYQVRMCAGAASVGMAQAAIDLAVEYSQQRIVGGKRISSFQNTQFVLAEAQTKVDAARFLVWRCAEALDNGTHEYWMSSMAKYYCAEVCGWVVDKCLQVYGGYGYCQDYDIERMYRDVRVLRILDGASEIHKRLISKHMGVR